MHIEIEGSPEQLRAVAGIRDLGLGRARQRGEGVYVAYGIVYREEVLDEVHATGAVVHVVKTEAELRADAERDAELTRAADQVRARQAEAERAKSQGKNKDKEK